MKHCNLLFRKLPKEWRPYALQKKGSPEFNRRVVALKILDIAFRTEYPNMLFKEIESNQHGKPYFEGGEPFFNFSYWNNSIACALSDSNIGIDLQGSYDNFTNVYRACFSNTEVDLLDSSSIFERNILCTKLWALKESLAKERGMGLTKELLRESFLTARKSDWFSQRQRWFQVALTNDNYVLAICSQTETRRKLFYLTSDVVLNF